MKKSLFVLTLMVSALAQASQRDTFFARDGIELSESKLEAAMSAKYKAGVQIDRIYNLQASKKPWLVYGNIQFSIQSKNARTNASCVLTIDEGAYSKSIGLVYPQSGTVYVSDCKTQGATVGAVKLKIQDLLPAGFTNTGR